MLRVWLLDFFRVSLSADLRQRRRRWRRTLDPLLPRGASRFRSWSLPHRQPCRFGTAPSFQLNAPRAARSSTPSAPCDRALVTAIPSTTRCLLQPVQTLMDLHTARAYNGRRFFNPHGNCSKPETWDSAVTSCLLSLQTSRFSLSMPRHGHPVHSCGP